MITPRMILDSVQELTKLTRKEKRLRDSLEGIYKF